jgi:predicted DNA binding protein
MADRFASPMVTPAAAVLTPRQAELLGHCIKRGYYDIPRKATLRTLGAELGITATSLSLALRRAEAKIILAYVDQNGSAGRP